MADKIIPGIHNYCDRWCERCDFASRCAIYEDEKNVPSEELEIGNKAFWDRLAENFSKARHMLEDAAARYDVDLETLAKEAEEYESKRKRIKSESREHPLAKLSFEYSNASRKWLESQPGMIEKLETLRDQLSMGATEVQEARKQTELIKDCLAVIQWYQTFIHVKLIRALTGRETGYIDEEEPHQSDYNGSAKIALIAIDRSMQAWIKLFELLPEREDDFLKILAMLDKIRKMAAEEFPDTAKFIRPGFDEQ